VAVLAFGPGTLAAALEGTLPGWPAGRLAVALSGGPDSAALLAAAAALVKRQPSLELRAVHVDHGLQAAAADFVTTARSQALAAGVQLTVLKVAVEEDAADGIEAAARRARYAALAGALRPGEALLTAHHREDQAETLLLQLLRGAGPRGLAAMPSSAALGAGVHLRPCLGVAREALASCAAATGWPTSTDPMNGDPRFDRAYLRSAVLPLVAARWPAWAATVARAARHFGTAQQVLDEVAAADLDGLEADGALDAAALSALPAARRDLALRHWLQRAGIRPPSAARLAALDEVLGARAGRCPVVALGGALVYRHGGRLCIGPLLPAWPGPAPIAPGAGIAVAAGGRITLEERGPGAGTLLKRRHASLELRPRHGGERLALRAGGPRRAVKDLLRESGLAAHLRGVLPFVWGGGDFVGVLTPRGLIADAAALAGGGEPGLELRWHDAPAALDAAFVEATGPLP
jgi:tRNA(Ile)-lysidine synthase